MKTIFLNYRRCVRYYVAVVLLLVVCAHAQHNDAGTTAFPFLNLTYDARSAAMSGASAMSFDFYGTLANPAAAGELSRMEVAFGYRQMIMDVWGGVFGVVIPTDFKGLVFSPYLMMLTSGELEVVNEHGVATGERATSAHTAFGFGASRSFGKGLTGGAAIKGMYHHISDGIESYTAEGVAIDLGVQYKTAGTRQVYGAALRNFGIMRGYFNDWNEHDLPYGIEVGASYVPRHMLNLRLALDVNKYNGDYMNFEPAFEYTVIQNTLFLRGGYSFSTVDFDNMLNVFSGDRDDTYRKSSINSLTFGFGIATSADNVDIKLDTAILFYSEVSGPSLAISLLVAF